MKLSTLTAATLSLTVAPAFAPGASAETVEFDFAGVGGAGLLSSNGVGPNTVPTLDGPSTAFGAEFGPGLVLDTDANTLSFAFAYSELAGGLFDAVGGIHLHLVPADAPDPFLATGPIIFDLNGTTDPNVTLTSSLNEIGDNNGAVTGILDFEEFQQDSFLNGRYYLNIHSAGFQGGELRGNLVRADGGGATPVPSPAAATAGLALLAGLAGRRRRA